MGRKSEVTRKSTDRAKLRKSEDSASRFVARPEYSGQRRVWGKSLNSFLAVIHRPFESPQISIKWAPRSATPLPLLSADSNQPCAKDLLSSRNQEYPVLYVSRAKA